MPHKPVSPTFIKAGSLVSWPQVNKIVVWLGPVTIQYAFWEFLVYDLNTCSIDTWVADRNGGFYEEWIILSAPQS